MLKIIKKSTYENLLRKIKTLQKIIELGDSHIEKMSQKYKGAMLRNPKTGQLMKIK